MKLSQLKIDPEFQSKIPPLQFEEEQQLEQNIIAEGRLLNPIITWNGYILDGHTRYRILKKHGFTLRTNRRSATGMGAFMFLMGRTRWKPVEPVTVARM